jgi:predicted O-methyltransferase YrrM
LGHEHQPQEYLATGDVHAALGQADQDRLRRMAMQRLQPFGVRATVYHMDSIEAAARFQDDSLDLVFVDGDHSKEGCARDLETWWPKIKPGGWMSGHDYLNSDRRFSFGVNAAVDQFVRRHGIDLEIAAGTCYFMRKY